MPKLPDFEAISPSTSRRSRRASAACPSLPATECASSTGPPEEDRPSGGTLVAAIRGTAWKNPRGPVSIDPDTRDITTGHVARKVEKVTESPTT